MGFRSAALAALALSASSGCAPTLVSCMDSKCPGCCTIQGLCSPGTDAKSCGVDGALCLACGRGETCQSGICGGPGGFNALCNSSNCVGCCSPQGDCLTPGSGDGSDDACGVNGETCSACLVSQTCNANGTCQNLCTGCIDASGSCVGGDMTNACGTGGVGCDACLNGDTCQHGACVTPPCGPGTCNGCCSHGSCVPFASQDATACGSAGDACAPCGAGAPYCQTTNGTCVAGTCSSATCAGCCNAQACVALSAESDASCGNLGNPCAPCPPGASHCDVITGVCTAATLCGATNCNGCCVGASCAPPGTQSASRCGVGGVACGTCSSTQVCDTIQGGCVSKTGLPGTVNVLSSGNALPPAWVLTNAGPLVSSGSNASAKLQIGTRVQVNAQTTTKSSPCQLPYNSGTHTYCDGFAETDGNGNVVIVDDYTYLLRMTPPCKAQLPPVGTLQRVAGIWQDHYSTAYGDVWVLAASECSDLDLGTPYAGTGTPPPTTDIHDFRSTFSSGGVTLRGVVVAVWFDKYTNTFAFTFEDPGGGPNSGLLVSREQTSSSTAVAPKVGDYAAVRGNATIDPGGYELLQL